MNRNRNRDMSKPHFIMLIGLPGSGKSTWLRDFLSKTDEEYVIISADDVVMELAEPEGLTYSQAFKKHIGQATKISKARATSAFNEGKNIIWDQTNMSEKVRRPRLQRALEKDYYIEAVDFQLLPQELEKRLRHREKMEDKHIPEHVMENFAKSYNCPSKKEGFVNFTWIRNY